MKKVLLPKILLKAKPEGLKFKVPDSALARWDGTLRAKAAPPASGQIDILGSIGFDPWTGEGVTAAQVKEALKAMGKAPVVVSLNSPGGDAFEGVAIYNLLREHPGEITVRVLGLAASAASVVAMAGDRIEMGEAAFLMIHSAWGVVIGNRNDMREFADLLDALDRSVAEVYARRSGQEVKAVLKMMEKETWLDAENAIETGFADASFAHEKAASAVFVGGSPRSAQPPPVALLAASGNRQRPAVRLSFSAPGASGSQSTTLPKGDNMKTIREQIASFEAKRVASVARMDEIMAKAGEEGRTLNETETPEYDGLKSEVQTIDDHLARLKAHEASAVARAAELPAASAAVEAASAAAAARGSSGIISVKSNAEPGIAFARYVKALAMARGNVMQALQIAKSNKNWRDTTPQVEKVLMAAVEGGDTTTAGWASELVYNQNLVDQFIELLRPLTILGKMTGLTRVPFNVRMSGQDSGSSAYWVGQGKPVPVSKLHTLEVTLGIAKAAGLVVLTEELVRSSAPSAEMLVRNDLLKAIATFLDVQFVDPNVAAVTNVSPASITNGVTPTVPTGTNAAALRADVQTLFKTFIQANMDPTSAVWIMETTQALAISLMQNALGQPEFPSISMAGGTFFGLPVIPSMSANIPGSPDSGKMVILANSSDILLADDGQLVVDASREASIQMLDNPTNDAAAGTPTTMVSMFQTGAVAIKAVRFINWKKRRSTAVAYIKEANYTA